jgi:hypothetical protein
VRYVLFDANHWKSFAHQRLRAAIGDRGSISLYGVTGTVHHMLAEHLTAEHRDTKEGRRRTVDEWRLTTPGADNHWLDCLVGACVAASMEGVTLSGTGASPAKRPVIRFSQALENKRREKRSGDVASLSWDR